MRVTIRSFLLLLLFVTSACANPSTSGPTSSLRDPHLAEQPLTSKVTLTSEPPTSAAMKPTLSSSRVYKFEYTPDGALLAVTERSLILFDTTHKLVRWSKEIAEGCCEELSISAELVAVIAGRGASVHVLETSSGQELYALLDAERRFSTLSFNREGNILATGEFGQIRLWDSRTGRELSAWQTGDEGLASFPWTKGITNLAFTLDDNDLYSANWWTGQVMKWHLASARLVSSFGLTNTVRYKFTPDARQLLVDFNQYGFEMRNPDTGALESVHPKIIGASGFVAFSLDGGRIAVWGYNGEKGSSASVWELSTDRHVQEFSAGNRRKPAWSWAALSPDGNILALSDETGDRVTFFNIASGEEAGSVLVP